MKQRLIWTAALIGFLAVNAYAFVFGDLAGLEAYLLNLGPWGILATVDLLAALTVAVAWTWVDARAKGLSPWPWALLTLGTGSVGILAYLALHGGPRRPRIARGADGTLVLTMTRELDAPAATVWPILADYHRVDRFHPWVKRVDVIGDAPCGVGAERVCHLEGMPALRERVTEGVEGRGYRISAQTPIAFLGELAGGLWLDAQPSPERTAVRFELSFKPKLGPIGRLLGRAWLGYVGEGMGPHILAGLEHHLRTGGKLAIGAQGGTVDALNARPQPQAGW